MRKRDKYIITAGASYLDIDAYACMVAMAELLNLCGTEAIAYSSARCNYSISKSLVKEGQIADSLPDDFDTETAKFVIVDVSDPAFFENSIPLCNVVAVYDHHIGFEQYWTERIGDGSRIEFIGAAATLIFREWKKAGLQYKMSRNTAELLAAAILDNTLNLASKNVTEEDKNAFFEICKLYNIDDEWRANYFSAVQENIESDLKRALLGDVKSVRDNEILPAKVGQLAVWNVERILNNLSTICCWFNERFEHWMINVIDIQHQCCYFVCEDPTCTQRIENAFGVRFDANVAKTEIMYLRKELIKKTIKR